MLFIFALGVEPADLNDWQHQIRQQYDQFGPALRRRCERVLHSTRDAEDIVQELFMDIWNKRRGDLDFPYLYSAATNRCITLLRKQYRHRTLLERNATRDMREGICADDSVYSQQCVRELASLLDKVAGAIFIYRYIDEMTMEEIGEVMGISRKTIGKKIAVLEKKLARYSHSKTRQHFEEAGE